MVYVNSDYHSPVNISNKHVLFATDLVSQIKCTYDYVLGREFS